MITELYLDTSSGQNVGYPEKHNIHGYFCFRKVSKALAITTDAVVISQ